MIQIFSKRNSYSKQITANHRQDSLVTGIKYAVYPETSWLQKFVGKINTEEVLKTYDEQSLWFYGEWHFGAFDDII